MNEVVKDIWPILLGAALSAVALYVGFINKMRSQIAVLEDNMQDMKKECKEVTDNMTKQEHVNTILEEKVKRMESRQESHSKKYDELLTLINEIKLEMVKQFSTLGSEIKSFNSMVEASDEGVKIRKKGK